MDESTDSLSQTPARSSSNGVDASRTGPESNSFHPIDEAADYNAHAPPPKLPGYERALQQFRAGEKSLDSFRHLYDRQLEALKWLAAFSLGGLFALGNRDVPNLSPETRVLLAAAGICFGVSVLGALAFYARYLQANEFIHVAEVRLHELNYAVSDVSLQAGTSVSAESTSRMESAADNVARLNWPQSVDRSSDAIAWRLCLAGFVLGATIVTVMEFATLLLF